MYLSPEIKMLESSILLTNEKAIEKYTEDFINKKIKFNEFSEFIDSIVENAIFEEQHGLHIIKGVIKTKLLKNILQSMLSPDLKLKERKKRVIEIEGDEPVPLVMDYNHDIVLRLLSLKYNWRGLRHVIPYINFPAHFEVLITMPFAGEVARFIIRHKDYSNDTWVSVFLDIYNHLGFARKPYYEVYPVGKKGDIRRFGLDKTKDMIHLIGNCLKYQIKNFEKEKLKRKD